MKTCKETSLLWNGSRKERHTADIGILLVFLFTIILKLLCVFIPAFFVLFTNASLPIMKFCSKTISPSFFSYLGEHCNLTSTQNVFQDTLYSLCYSPPSTLLTDILKQCTSIHNHILCLTKRSSSRQGKQRKCQAQLQADTVCFPASKLVADCNSCVLTSPPSMLSHCRHPQAI